MALGCVCLFCAQLKFFGSSIQKSIVKDDKIRDAASNTAGRAHQNVISLEDRRDMDRCNVGKGSVGLGFIFHLFSPVGEVGSHHA